MMRFRVISPNANLEGIEQITDEESTYIKAIGIELDGEQIFINLNPNPEEGAAILKRNPDSLTLKKILAKYGFVSPAVIVIEDYVEFFMTRRSEEYSELRIQEGLWAEKAFDLLLQSMGMYVNYPEPIRDWRLLQPLDFYVPLLGKLDAKSVTAWEQWDGSVKFRVNVRKPQLAHSAFDYVVALQHLGGPYLMLIGAMTFSQVKSYEGTEYDIPHGRPAFWSIPVDDFANAIKPKKLLDALLRVKYQIDSMPKIELKEG